MNANDRRNQLIGMIDSLSAHLSDQCAESAREWNKAGPRNWKGVGDLENVLNMIARAVSTMSNGAVTPEDAIEEAKEIVCG